MNISKRWYLFGSSSWITMIQRVISWFRLGQFSEDYPFGRKILAAFHLAQTTTDRKICNVHLFINFPDLVARRLSKIGTWKWSSFCYRNSKEHEDSIVQSFQTIRNQWPIWACLGKFPLSPSQSGSNNFKQFDTIHGWSMPASCLKIMATRIFSSRRSCCCWTCLILLDIHGLLLFTSNLSHALWHERVASLQTLLLLHFSTADACTGHRRLDTAMPRSWKSSDFICPAWILPCVGRIHFVQFCPFFWICERVMSVCAIPISSLNFASSLFAARILPTTSLCSCWVHGAVKMKFPT